MSSALLLDTNVVIFALQGSANINSLITNQRLFLSSVTEIELLSWPLAKSQYLRLVKDFVALSTLIEYFSSLKDQVIQFRRTYNLKLADAFIAATAAQLDVTLVSADIGFSKLQEFNFIKVNL